MYYCKSTTEQNKKHLCTGIYQKEVIENAEHCNIKTEEWHACLCECFQLIRQAFYVKFLP